jgi:DnaJ family protein C protein 28
VNFDRVIEEQLRQAREAGKFDNLRGHGQPLALDDNPFEDPAWSLAHDLLKKNGFRPDWLEDDVSIREELAQARRSLLGARDRRAADLAALAGQSGAQAIKRRHTAEQAWDTAQARFRARLGEINKQIFHLNLKVPSTRLQRLKLDVEAELAKLAG